MTSLSSESPEAEVDVIAAAAVEEGAESAADAAGAEAAT